MICFLIVFFERIFPGRLTESCVNDGSYCFPKIVWTYWGGNIPEDIEEMLRITREAFTKIAFHFLTNENLSDFLYTKNISTVFPEPSEKADYIRVCLIEKYGGMWMDAGTIVNSETEMEYIISEAINSKCIFLGFSPNDKRYRFIAGFFGAPRNSSFMKIFKNNYDEMVSGNLEEYIFKGCKQLRSHGYEIADVLCTHHAGIDFLFHKINFENPYFDQTALYLPQNRSILRIHEGCPTDVWEDDVRCVVCRVLHDIKSREIPFIHLGRHARNGKRIYYKEGLFLNSVDCFKLHKTGRQKNVGKSLKGVFIIFIFIVVSIVLSKLGLFFNFFKTKKKC